MLSVVSLAATLLSLATSANSAATPAVNSTTCNGRTYVYQQLAGYGFVPGDAYDKFGDTSAGIGTSIAFEKSSWKKTATGYTGIIWTLPDRGWNTEGTLNFQPRVHKFKLEFTPKPAASEASPAGPNILLTYLDTIRFTDPLGEPMTGLDADPTGAAHFPSYPDLPVATYTGDGFGRPGPGGKRVSLDPEGLALASDGSFWISDEYGPYIYRFDAAGKMQQATRPPDALIPMRHGAQSFSSATAPRYDPSRKVKPADPDSGRANNHGLEAVTLSPDGNTLYAMVQAALIQDGGRKSATERHTRLLVYDVSQRPPRYTAEHVVPLPLYDAKGGKTKVAAQSEMHYLSPTQLLVLARDSNAGRAAEAAKSRYRHVDVIDISNATDVKGPTSDCATCGVASADGVLRAGIVPVVYCPWLDFNVNAQLRRFGLHNGGDQNATLLNEKWESMALAPVDGKDGSDGKYFLFSFSDNDFITQNGYLADGTFEFADQSGYELDNQVLAFEVQLPIGSRP